MGTEKDKDKKQQEKLEKKRLKQQYKLEKKRQGTRQESTAETTTKEQYERPAKGKTEPIHAELEVAKVPWYKNPDWLRAIAAIASLIVAIIAIIFSFT
jgi:hypothetical protein